jgi:hypothetical protein
MHEPKASPNNARYAGLDPPAGRSSSAGLTRPSIIFAKRSWIAGSSPAMTVPVLQWVASNPQKQLIPARPTAFILRAALLIEGVVDRGAG